MENITETSKIKKIVLKAGGLLSGAAGENLIIRTKSSQKDLITQYDTLIQDYIVNELQGLIPNAQFVGEESGMSGRLDAEDLFIIDPIDGTANFIHSMRYSAVSVAWYKNGRPFYGIVFNPYTDEIYEAKSGNGAFMNSRRLRIHNAPLQDSIAAFGTSPYNSETTDCTFDMVKKIYGKCQDIRRMGAASLDICQVASGRIGLFFEAALSLWDYAAAQIILIEAGGTIVNFKGDKIGLSAQKSSVIAGSKSIILESKLIREG